MVKPLNSYLALLETSFNIIEKLLDASAWICKTPDSVTDAISSTKQKGVTYGERRLYEADIYMGGCFDGLHFICRYGGGIRAGL